MKKLLFLLVVVTLTLTNLSQLPVLISLGLNSFIATVLWLVLFLITISIYSISKWPLSNLIFKIMAFILIFITLLILASLLGGDTYYSSQLAYSFYVSMFVLLVGYLIYPIIDRNSLSKLLFYYVLSVLFLSLIVFIEFFLNDFDFSVRTYAYSNKNSISLMIFTAIAILLFVKKQNKKSIKFFKGTVILFLTYMLMALKSRGAIFQVIFIVIFMYIKVHKKYKFLFISSITIGILAIVFVPEINNLVIKQIIFANSDPTDINAISSGRISLILNFPELIKGYELFGNTSYYLDFFPMNAWLTHGYIIGTIFITISLFPIIFACKKFKYKMNDGIVLLFFVIAFSYFFNGFFEALAPFGPGVKTYLLWFLFGIFLSDRFSRVVK